MSQDIQALVKRAFAAQQSLLQANSSIAVDLAKHQAANPTDSSTLIGWGGPSLKLQTKAMELGTLAVTFTGLAMAHQAWSLGQKIPNAPSLPEPKATPAQIDQLDKLETLVKAVSGGSLDQRKAAIEAS